MAGEAEIELEEDAPIVIDVGEDEDTEALALATEKEAKEPELDAGTKVLTDQIAAAENAAKLANERAAVAEQERNDALAFAQQREREAWESTTRETQSYADRAQTGLAGAQGELQAAKQAYAVAFEAGDPMGQADANARIARASTDIRGWEQSAAEASQREAYVRQQAQQPRPQQQPQQFTAEQLLMRNEQNPNILPSEKSYLRAHPELTLDQRMQRRLQVAVEEATDKGVTRGSDAFFQHLDQRMGYDNGGGSRQTNVGARVSAPVSRGGGGPAAKPNRVTLTERDIEIANSMGIKSPDQLKEYARNKLKVPERMKELNGGMNK